MRRADSPGSSYQLQPCLAIVTALRHLWLLWAASIRIRNGRDPRAVIADWQRKSYGEESTFEHDLELRSLHELELHAGRLNWALDEVVRRYAGNAVTRGLDTRLKFLVLRV